VWAGRMGEGMVVRRMKERRVGEEGREIFDFRES
jgi:hypothetical protein